MENIASDFLVAFNTSSSPKDVLHLSQRLGLSTGEIAKILYEAADRASVELLGSCLGHHSEFGQELAKCYPELFTCFAGMDLVSALRAYLWRFRLPGEAAQIDRIISGFAHSFFLYNSPPPRPWDAGDGGCINKCAIKGSWDAGAHGWYIKQPLSGPYGVPCCVHCGALDGDIGELRACTGCQLVHFCRKCRKLASRQGHAVVGAFGYGRACVAAQRAAGVLHKDGMISFEGRGGELEKCVVPSECYDWQRKSPIVTEDAVMVLAFAVVMLTTNLHNPQVKQKMQKHEFIKQNRDVNGGGNFPGDFLEQIYDQIKQEELKVMRPGE